MVDPVTRLSVGERVVIRHTLNPAEIPATGARLTDVVGILLAVTDHHLTVETRNGERVVDRATVVAAKEVPPRPSRPGRPHRAIGVEDLQRAMVDAWPPVEREPLGQWLLRASSGFTSRGNSVLVVGDPGRPLPQSVDDVERWYAARGLPAQLALSGPVDADDPDPRAVDTGAGELGQILTQRGYARHSAATVMTAAAAEVAGSARTPTEAAGAASILLERELTADWMAAYAAYRPVVPGATETILRGSPVTVFASAVSGGEVLGLARLGIAHRWGGVSAVWVRPDARRLGLARALSTALAQAALREGVASLHLQVEQTNVAATALYEELGFSAHHAYAYLRRPT